MKTRRWAVTAFWVLLCAGVALWTVPWGDWNLAGRWAAGISLAVAGAISVPLVSIVVHELSHAVVAAVTGNRIHGIYTWFPFGLVHFKLASTWVVAGRSIRGGMCHVLPKSPDARTSAWVYAAGGLGNLALAIVFFAVWLGPAKGFLAETWSLASAAYNLGAVIITFWPSDARVVDMSMPTDGQALYRRWQAAGEDDFEERTSSYAFVGLIRGRHAEAELHFRRVLARNPENEHAKYGLALSLYGQNRLVESAPIFRELIGRADSPRTHDARSSLALVEVLRGGDRELADRISREAVEAAPFNPTYRHIRGFVLHVLGNHEEGKQLLEKAYRTHPFPFSRAGCAVLLARAAVDRGDRKEALEWIRKARRLDADGWLLEDVLKRAEQAAS